ncbi:DUF6879 family protein [Nocardia farcinica]|uniref:DUF6879 family protein n=1 Tax=Nocardia farcinica TaxID=37329 RepID=UPI00341FAADF
MRQVPGGDPFDRVLDQAQRRAFHLETRDDYLTASESQSLAAWLADESSDPGGDWFTPWTQQVQRMTARGVAVQRARIVTEPHTDYTRYLLALARHNIGAGEDVRYLPRADATPADSAAEDMWLLDDATVVYSVFDDQDHWIGGVATDNAGLVQHAIAIRDRVWRAAIPYRDYVDRRAP